MEELRLVIPDITLADEIRAYRQEMLDALSSMDGTGTLRRHENPADWLAMNDRFANRDTVPEGWVQSTQFVCLRGERLVGMIQVRHAFNDYLRDYAGHIGYSVRPSDRRKGVAAWMLGAVLPYCRQIGLQQVMVACEPDNPGSSRTILKNGGVYGRTVHEPREDIDLEQYWITL